MGIAIKKRHVILSMSCYYRSTFGLHEQLKGYKVILFSGRVIFAQSSLLRQCPIEKQPALVHKIMDNVHSVESVSNENIHLF